MRARRRWCYVVCLVGSAGLMAAVAPPAMADRGAGETIVDETDPPPPADPTVTSANTIDSLGPTGTDGCTKAFVDSDASLSENGLMACSTTSAGTFALSGSALDQAGDPVAGATVSLSPSTGGTTYLTWTDTDGAFAFSDVPVSGNAQRYDVAVEASGFGAYSVINSLYDANQTYVIAVELDPTVQSYDESASAFDSTLGLAKAGTTDYTSHTRTPPKIKVALYKLAGPGADAPCARHPDNELRAVKWYPWRFYVLHTAASEIDTRWGERAWKASTAPIQNYAWLRKLEGPKGGIGGAEIENTVNHQCFKPWIAVPMHNTWSDWADDVFDERVATGGAPGIIQETQYRAGTYNCNEQSFPADGNKLSQNGARARAESNTSACGGNETWRDIVEHYYTGTVRPAEAAGAPGGVSHGVSGKSITFDWGGPAGWRFKLQRYPVRCPDGTLTCWGEFYNKGWSWKKRAIPTRFTYSTVAGCMKYRVIAHNPVGDSAGREFNNGNNICV
jgi:hypothetical protein